MRHRLFIIALFAWLAMGALAQTSSSSSSTYIPGVTYQTANPNYPIPNPFYFEGRVDWNLLKITQPSNAWEYAQRGIYRQDDLEDYTDAIADYQQSIAMNNLGNNTCQVVTKAPTGPMNPPPCMFTVRLRLAGLLMAQQPAAAIELYQEVLAIDPLHLGVHAAIGETYVTMAEQATDPTTVPGLYQQAITQYNLEIALSPVTPLQTQVTGDTANNAHVHWALAEIYETLNQPANEMSELSLYLQATKWHSDTYPWRIQLAQIRMQQAQAKAIRDRERD
jgi:tetratricopeptide (TPR) repeat protein